jgi:DNA-binding NarL/FixJ family response regulator
MMTITVFLADDHAVLRDGLKFMIEAQAGMRVVGAAGDGREAVRQVEQLCPDVVIMDIAMPELNGIDATHQIGDLCPQTGVIILSMHHSPEHINRALQAGALGYLLKETASSEIIEAITQVNAGHRYLCKKVAAQMVDHFLNPTDTGPGGDVLTVLSPREREVLQLVVEGNTTADIADSLALSTRTVDNYRSRIMQKLNINTLPDLVKFAIKHGITSVE